MLDNRNVEAHKTTLAEELMRRLNESDDNANFLDGDELSNFPTDLLNASDVAAALEGTNDGILLVGLVETSITKKYPRRLNAVNQHG